MNAIRAATTEDAGAIVRIYNHYVLNTVVPFEEVPVDAPTMVDVGHWQTV